MSIDENFIGHADFASRVHARAVFFGAVIILAAFGVLMALGGAFGLWSGGVLDAASVASYGAGFYIWAALAWIAATFAGAFFAATAARPAIVREGLLNGAAAWATACVSAVVLGCVWYMSAIFVGLATVDASSAMLGRGALLGMFFADLLAFAGALLGGWIGYLSEAEGAKREPRPARVSAPVGEAARAT